MPLPQISKHETTTIIIYSFICDVLRNLVPLAQFKKREKHPWRSATFISLLKVRLLRGCFPRFLNFKNCTKSRNGLHILYSSTTSNFHCFTVCILLPYSFWFTSVSIIVKFPESVTFYGAALIRERPLLEDGNVKRYCNYIKVAFIWGLVLTRRNMIYFSFQTGLACYLN